MSQNITVKVKKRYWAFVAYPESAPPDLFKQLQMTGMPIAISPLHDKDLEADEQTPKKPHWHIILCYSGPQTYNAVKNLTASFNSPAQIPIEAVRGYYSYLTHKDNPENVQYEEKDITCLNGFSIYEFVELTKNEVFQIKKALLDIIKEREIIEYCDLLEYLKASELESELDVAFNNTMFLNTYISSRRHKTVPVGKSDSIAGLAKEANC